MAIINLDAVEYVTLYTGNNSPKYCTCNCPCCSQTGRDYSYQGTIKQVQTMLDKLPNLKQLYLMGNPDVTVDPEFCNNAMKHAIERGVRVCFSTSGVGGKNVLLKLLKDIPPSEVDYISISFDGTSKEEMSLLKGIDYPMEAALDGLKWGLDNGYIMKVQPTLWSYNYENTEKIIDFFYDKGVRWFTFHIGSLESKIFLPTHKHLTPQQIKEVHQQINNSVYKYGDIKVKCPIIYRECGDDEPGKWHCMHPQRIKALQVLFTEDGVKATHTPIAGFFNEELMFNLEESGNIYVPEIPKSKVCPLSRELSGRADTYCRYVSRYWNY